MQVKLKPWGKEWIAYQNEHVAIWHLVIDPWQETSLHSHPNKKTGLIVLDGAAEVSFLSGSQKLFAGQKTMIRHGVFHRTKNMTRHPLELFEIETPVDKSDIVRINDAYGRHEFNPDEPSIESKSAQRLESNFPTFREGSCNIGFSFLSKTLQTKVKFRNYASFLFLSGGLTYKDKHIVSAGDIVSGENLNLFVQQYELQDSQVITVENEHLERV